MNQASPHSWDCPLSLRESHPTRGARGMTLYIKLKKPLPYQDWADRKRPLCIYPHFALYMDFFVGGNLLGKQKSRLTMELNSPSVPYHLTLQYYFKGTEREEY